MARLTNQQKAEIVDTFYGINPTTYKIHSVSWTRGGTMRMGQREEYYQGPYPAKEVGILFGLFEVQSVGPPAFSQNSEKFVLERLEKKAMQMKLEDEGRA